MTDTNLFKKIAGDYVEYSITDHLNAIQHDMENMIEEYGTDVDKQVITNLPNMPQIWKLSRTNIPYGKKGIVSKQFEQLRSDYRYIKESMFHLVVCADRKIIRPTSNNPPKITIIFENQ